MTERDAQKSEVHESTADAGASPASSADGGQPGRGTRPAASMRPDAAGAASTGAAPASNFERGAADRDIAITGDATPDDAASTADPGGRAPASGSAPPAITPRAEPLDTGPITPDESDYGGPVRIDTDMIP